MTALLLTNFPYVSQKSNVLSGNKVLQIETFQKCCFYWYLNNCFYLHICLSILPCSIWHLSKITTSPQPRVIGPEAMWGDRGREGTPKYLLFGRRRLWMVPYGQAMATLYWSDTISSYVMDATFQSYSFLAGSSFGCDVMIFILPNSP